MLARRNDRGASMRNGMFDCFEFARTTVCQTEIRLSDIFDFPRRSSRFNDFPDRATWLLLALKAPLCRVVGRGRPGVPRLSGRGARFLRSSHYVPAGTDARFEERSLAM